MIISVSRRCDIPRFSFDWFMERLDAGFAEVENPFNPSQIKRVSLLPPVFGSSVDERKAEDCAEVFAFWTRDPEAILLHSDNLEKRGFGFYVMTTLTSYPGLLEPNAPAADAVIKTMGLLAQKITPLRVIWRYDPVFLSNITDFEFHRRNFRNLAARIGGFAEKVIVSVYDEYSRAEKRLSVLEQKGSLVRMPHYADIGFKGERPLLPAVKDLLAEMAAIASEAGLEMQCCAEDLLLDGNSGCRGIKNGSCIDASYIEKVFNVKNPGKDRYMKRKNCLCARSIDIGAYGPCPSGCVYCYARPVTKGW